MIRCDVRCAWRAAIWGSPETIMLFLNELELQSFDSGCWTVMLTLEGSPNQTSRKSSFTVAIPRIDCDYWWHSEQCSVSFCLWITALFLGYKGAPLRIAPQTPAMHNHTLAAKTLTATLLLTWKDDSHGWFSHLSFQTQVTCNRNMSGATTAMRDVFMMPNSV